MNTMKLYELTKIEMENYNKKKPAILADLVDLHNLDIKEYENIYVLDNMEFDNLNKILDYIYKKFNYI